LTSILLIYPYFHPSRDDSIFRFPPLGVAYLAAALRQAGYGVNILDGTFMLRDEALDQAARAGADIVGIYSMFSLKENALAFARSLRGKCRLLIAGGPLPTCDPDSFLDDFDIVVIGEGEHTILDIVAAYESDRNFQNIPGIVQKIHPNEGAPGREAGLWRTPPRVLELDLDGIAFPARDLIPNKNYIEFGKRQGRLATTSVITTRGCPFNCDFCSNAVFGNSYRERSAGNVIDEVEQVLSLGYERIHFADDVFTLNPERVVKICREICQRNVHFRWECLGRVDSIDSDLAGEMKRAGCDRVFFGIESGSNAVLKLMNKGITVVKARNAVRAAHHAGLETGAFFMLGYPGETDDTVLETIRLANSLPLDYLSFTIPYPLPGTALYARITKGGDKPAERPIDQKPFFKAGFSGAKLQYARLTGEAWFRIKKGLGKAGPVAVKPFEILFEAVFRLLR
jgi:anaerobic magnesium-protoporphyrin IX monomethyl ester cyclase